jgi:hypothetical protein
VRCRPMALRCGPPHADSSASMGGPHRLARAHVCRRGSALAGTYNHTDARHDVKRYPQMQRAPHNRQSDVTHPRIVHNDKDVRFYVIPFRFHEGCRLPNIWSRAQDSRHDYTASFIWNPGGDQQDDLFDETTGQSISCDQTVTRNGRTYLLRVNRVCLQKPRWVRAAVGTATILGTNDSRGDNALSNYWRAKGNGPFSSRVRSSI